MGIKAPYPPKGPVINPYLFSARFVGTSLPSNLPTSQGASVPRLVVEMTLA